MRRLLVAVAVSTATLAGTAGVAQAAGGPPEDVIDANWICGPVESGGELPPGHCIKGNSNSATFTILVFEDGFRQETGSTDPKADDRPCKHDSESPDGTYWEPVPGLYVCHHTPSSPPGQS